MKLKKKKKKKKRHDVKKSRRSNPVRLCLITKVE